MQPRHTRCRCAKARIFPRLVSSAQAPTAESRRDPCRRCCGRVPDHSVPGHLRACAIRWHPMLVHFPVACWSLAVTADVGGLWHGETVWRWSGGLLAVGCGMALIAILAGMIELPRVPEGPPMRDTDANRVHILRSATSPATRPFATACARHDVAHPRCRGAHRLGYRRVVWRTACLRPRHRAGLILMKNSRHRPIASASHREQCIGVHAER